MANDHAPHRILVADDQADVLEALRLLLKAEGYQIETVKSPAAVIKAVEARDFDLAIIAVGGIAAFAALDYTRNLKSLRVPGRLLRPTLPVATNVVAACTVRRAA